MKIKDTTTTTLIKQGIKYLDKDPIQNFPKLIKWARKFPMLDANKVMIDNVEKMWSDEENNWHKFIYKLLTDINPVMRKKLLTNFALNAGFKGSKLLKDNRIKYKCNIPWAILMDPTSACNLNCLGCWAAEYKKNVKMDNDTLDRIIKEGKELGTYMYILSGGEPLVRKWDVLELAKKHDDCVFLAFTNGTLIDDEYAKAVSEVGNLTFAISVEGNEELTDMRRGKGTYQLVMNAMDSLRKYGVGFGFSTCYHSKNIEFVLSEEYYDLMIEKGCYFGWFFTYIPVGKGAVTDLITTPQQRKFAYHKVRELRKTKPVFTMDFWNDGEFVDGCIAGGRRYLHINANGDVEPCAFIHYSNVNIKDVSLLEALQSPLFMEYHKNQPFNENMLRPCPLLDNPEKLQQMVTNSKAKSTQPGDKENVFDLTSKTIPAAKKWAPVADKLWAEFNPCKKCNKKEV